jgi:hypothetical protein
MKRIKTSAIAPGAAMPLKSGMIDLVQDNVKDCDARIVRAFDQSAGSQPVILFGSYTLSGGTYQFEAGALLLSGEIYRFASVNVTPGVGQVVVGTITEQSQSGASLDPVQFSNGSSNNVNMDRIIVWSAGTAGSGSVNLSSCEYACSGYVNAYNAGLLTASSGAWTIPGASDWDVNVSVTGCMARVKFRITNGTLSLATANIRFDVLFLGAISLIPVRRAVGYCFMKNSNNSPANEIARVAVSPATSNRVYIERVTGTNIAAITGGLDVEGEIVFEIDRGFNS